MYLALQYTVQHEVPGTVQAEVPGTSHDNSTYVAGSRAGTVPADPRVAGGGVTGGQQDRPQAGGPTGQAADRQRPSLQEFV